MSFRWSGLCWIQQSLQLRWAPSMPSTSLTLDSFPSTLTWTFVRWLQTIHTDWKCRNVHIWIGIPHWENPPTSLPKCMVAYSGKSEGNHSPSLPVCFSAETPAICAKVDYTHHMCCFLLSPYTNKQNVWNSYLWRRHCWNPQTREPSRWRFVFVSEIQLLNKLDK